MLLIEDIFVEIEIENDQLKHILNLAVMIMEDAKEEKWAEELKKIENDSLSTFPLLQYQVFLEYCEKTADEKWKYPNLIYQQYKKEIGDLHLLDLACIKGNLPLVKALLGRGLSQHVGRLLEPLFAAVTSGNVELIKLLCEHAAGSEVEPDYNWFGFMDSNVLQFAVMLGNVEAFQCLYNQENFNYRVIISRDKKLYADTVSFAILSGQYRCINHFIEHNVISPLDLETKHDIAAICMRGFDILFDKDLKDNYKFPHTSFDGILAVAMQLFMLNVKFDSERHGERFFQLLQSVVQGKIGIKDFDFSLNLLCSLKKLKVYQSFSNDIKASIDAVIHAICFLLRGPVSLKQMCQESITNHFTLFKPNLHLLPSDLQPGVNPTRFIYDVLPKGILKILSEQIKLAEARIDSSVTQLKDMKEGLIRNLKSIEEQEVVIEDKSEIELESQQNWGPLN